MKKTIDFYSFAESIRELRPDNFSFEGLRTLFNYLEKAEEEMIDFNIIDVCTNYSEDSIKNVLEDYRLFDLDELGTKTHFIKVNNETIIYTPF